MPGTFRTPLPAPAPPSAPRMRSSPPNRFSPPHLQCRCPGCVAEETALPESPAAPTDPNDSAHTPEHEPALRAVGCAAQPLPCSAKPSDPHADESPPLSWLASRTPCFPSIYRITIFKWNRRLLHPIRVSFYAVSPLAVDRQTTDGSFR